MAGFFALDLEGHTVTVVGVQTAIVVRRMAVNNTITKLQISADGKRVMLRENHPADQTGDK